jgi:integrase/recombinase XerD
MPGAALGMKSDTNTRVLRRTDGSFHHIKPIYAEHALSSALGSGLISDDDKVLIETYVIESKTAKRFGVSHANKITYGLIRWRNYLGEYRQTTYTDVYRAIDRIKTSPIREKPKEDIPYSENTLRDFISILKGFYIWLITNNYSRCPMDKIGAIGVPLGNTMCTTAEDLLSHEDLLAMIMSCKSAKDRAFIATLFDGAFRIQELCTLTWGQLQINDLNVIANVNGKTGKARSIPLILAKPYITQWNAEYPCKITKDALVFLSSHNTPMRYGAVAKHIREIAKRAGITKNVKPHLFRHSKVTDWLRQGMPETAVKDFGWGNRKTKMLDTYGHLNNNEYTRMAMEKSGITVPTEHKPNVLNPRQCSNCAKVNTPTSNYCAACGMPLTPEASANFKQLKTEIEQHPYYQTLMKNIGVLIQSGLIPTP